MKRCKDTKRENGTTSYACPVDGVACEVVLHVEQRTGHFISSVVAQRPSVLPCDRCRKMEQQAGALASVRLGKHERRVLLEAPSADEDPRIIEPLSGTRAGAEALRRALRKLDAAGLIDLRWTDDGRQIGKRGFYPRRCVIRTPLGDGVVRELAERLRQGRPVRWASVIPRAIATARLETPQLVRLLAEAASSERERHMSLAQLTEMAMPYSNDRSRTEQEIKRDMTISEEFRNITEAAQQSL